MINMTKTSSERLAVMETKINSIEKTNEEQSGVLKRIEDKLDHVIECKADKTEVDSVRNKVNKVIYGAMTGLILLLITTVGFLLRYNLFK